jgi:hypothetical protein
MRFDRSCIGDPAKFRVHLRSDSDRNPWMNGPGQPEDYFDDAPGTGFTPFIKYTP